MHSVNFSNKAVEDLSNIWNYSAKRWSIRQANYYYNFITLYCKSIGNYDETEKNMLFYKVDSKESVVG